jgi:hypothetical protein
VPDSMAALGGDLNSGISIGFKLIVVPTPAHSCACAWRPASIPGTANSPTDLAQREDGLYQFAFIMSIKELLC